MTKKIGPDRLDEAEVLEYAKLRMRIVWCICWDNGEDAWGTFPWTFESQDHASAEAEQIQDDNRAQGIWGENSSCVANATLKTIDPEGDEAIDPMEELRKAALNATAGRRQF
jgi:hypothetical protein